MNASPFVGCSLILTALTAFAVDGENDSCSHECTSWMVFRDLTKTNAHFLHKNRDSQIREIISLKSGPDSPRKWIGLGNNTPKDPKAESVCMGMNASGLAVAVNCGETCVEPSNPKGNMETPEILRACLENCDTASQAVAKMDEIRKARQYTHGKQGSIFFFMDLKEAYIAEITAERISAVRYDHGYALRANIWHNPDMAEAADNSIAGWLTSSNREYMVIRDLNRALRKNQKITVPDMLAMSRDAKSPEGSPVSSVLCSQSTNSSSTLEISLNYPDVLSTGYFLIGPPRHTICVPVPVCVEEYLPGMKDLTWSAAAWKRFDKNGFSAELPPAWTEFEARSLKKYRQAQSQAENLLENGKKTEAVKLLNDTARSIWKETELRLLQEADR